MNSPFAHLETTSRVIKRAQYEAFEFTIGVDGVVVRNASHANPDEHEYVVTVEDGLPTECNCPADANYDGACKHRVAVAIRRPILDAAVDRQVAADGGTPISTADDSDDTINAPETPSTKELDDSTVADDVEDAEPDACDCDELPDGFPCWECVRTGRRVL
ncbi:SWIM zinc finger [Natronoarchaeum philippinense]|uniref:SWIM zinc finger n=1 Tax=Natronoarchaeum philippinense TaxID=558529 RepID=A0A285P619_NATPI|nr:SWIM zinc finger family protein [Natronoarchaeum philippinense]SNZ15321.1 SWIM zinc finger [Natronoarchaeum philippinense]